MRLGSNSFNSDSVFTFGTCTVHCVCTVYNMILALFVLQCTLNVYIRVSVYYLDTLCPLCTVYCVHTTYGVLFRYILPLKYCVIQAMYYLDILCSCCFPVYFVLLTYNVLFRYILPLMYYVHKIFYLDTVCPWCTVYIQCSIQILCPWCNFFTWDVLIYCVLYTVYNVLYTMFYLDTLSPLCTVYCIFTV